MGDLATTKLSSKGQVVIPEDIRAKLGLEPGSQFVVVGRGDTVVLKLIQTPALSEFRPLLDQARRAARRAGMRRDDLKKVIRDKRSKR